MKNGKSKIIYGNGINLVGLYDTGKPVRLKWDSNLKKWYANSGNFSVRKIGLDIEEGSITFASRSKKDVENWIRGVLSTMRLLKEWVK